MSDTTPPPARPVRYPADIDRIVTLTAGLLSSGHYTFTGSDLRETPRVCAYEAVKDAERIYSLIQHGPDTPPAPAILSPAPTSPPEGKFAAMREALG